MQIHWTPLRNGNGNGHTVSHASATWVAHAQGVATPRADVVETKDALVIELELPGHELEDIDVELEGARLTVKAERKEPPMPDRTYHRAERPQGVISRSFALPTMVDKEQTTATYRNGVLRIELPKREGLEPRQIPVSTSG